MKEAAKAEREAAKAEREKNCRSHMKVERSDKHAQWELHHVLNEINLKRMWMTPSTPTFVVSVLAHTRRMWALVESGFNAVAADGFMKIVWTMQMWKKIAEGCVPCVNIQS